MKKTFFLLLATLCVSTAEAAEQFLQFGKTEGNQLCMTGTTDTIQYDVNDWEGVKIAVRNLRNDLRSLDAEGQATD